MPLVILLVNGRSQDSDPQPQSLCPSMTLATTPLGVILVFPTALLMDYLAFVFNHNDLPLFSPLGDINVL